MRNGDCMERGKRTTKITVDRRQEFQVSHRIHKFEGPGLAPIQHRQEPRVSVKFKTLVWALCPAVI